MAYESKKKKKSDFIAGTATAADYFDFIQSGINKRGPIQQILDLVGSVYGASLRTYEFESELVADDVALDEYAIVEENNYAFYKITNTSATGKDVALTSGLTAEYQLTLKQENEEYESVANFIASSPSSQTVNIVGYYNTYLPEFGTTAQILAGPKGGFSAHKTGGTNAAPTVGSPVSVSTIGTGTQAGYYWTADGVEFKLETDDKLDPHQFGAVGDGATSDTIPIDDMWAFYISKTSGLYSAALTGEQTGASISHYISWLPGDYVYNGTGLINDTADVKTIKMVAVPGTVRIRLASGIYFVTADDVNNAYFYGINFYGGAGAFKATYTLNNVRARTYFGHCNFHAYTECAIGNMAEDYPYLDVEYCRFRGDTNSDTIGIAWGGFIDGGGIRHCMFDRNKYDIKIGERLSGNFHIENNDFIFLSSAVTNRVSHIWIVPNSTDAGGNSSGQNITITKNKFGNESMAVDDWRILIATEDTGTGTDRLSHPHLATWDTASFVTGIKIYKNHFAGIGSQTAALIYSYVRDVRAVTFKNNHMQSGDHTYLVEWAGTLNSDEHSSMWDISLDIGSNPNVRNMKISNQPLGLVSDKFVQAGGDKACMQDYPTVGDDASFIELLSQQAPISDGSVVNATRAAASGVYGATTAAEIDASSSTGRWVSAAITDPTPGLPAFVEFDIKASSTNPAARIEVSIKHSVTNLYVVRRYIACPSDWQKIRIPFVPQTNAGAANSYQLAVQVLGYSEGVADRFQIDSLCVYHSRQAMNYGHLASYGNMLWDGPHIVLGSGHHMFMNGNDLRLTIGAPTSATDGALIATAT